MAGQYSGISKAEYSPAGQNAWVDLGEIREDSEGYKPEVPQTPTAAGRQLYCGKKESVSLSVFDFDKFEALETIMKADGKIDVRLTTIDTTVLPVIEGLSVTVMKNYGMKVGERNFFTLKGAGYSV